MKKKIVLKGSLFFLFLFLSTVGSPQNPVLKEITNGVVTVTPNKKKLQSLGWANDIINSVAIYSSKGIVLVDTQNTPSNALQIKKAISTYFSDTTFVYVINTHGLVCHTGGNVVFDRDKIVGHINAVDEIHDFDDFFLGQTVDFLRKRNFARETQLDTMQNKQNAFSDSIKESIDLFTMYENDLIENYKPRVPDVTFEDRLQLTSGDITIDLFYMGVGHSSADVSVYFPEKKVLCTGNLFHLGSFDNGAMPSFYIHRDNEIEKWISSLEYILEHCDIKYVLTTHGKKPFEKRDLKFILAYCKAVKAEVEAVKAEGRSLNDIIDISAFSNLFREYSDVVKTNENTQEMHARNMGIIWDHIK